MGKEISSLPIVNDDKNDDDMEDDIDGLLHDTFGNVIEENDGNDGPNEEEKKFYNLINEAKQELYI